VADHGHDRGHGNDAGGEQRLAEQRIDQRRLAPLELPNKGNVEAARGCPITRGVLGNVPPPSGALGGHRTCWPRSIAGKLWAFWSSLPAFTACRTHNRTWAGAGPRSSSRARRTQSCNTPPGVFSGASVLAAPVYEVLRVVGTSRPALEPVARTPALFSLERAAGVVALCPSGRPVGRHPLAA
jgi:hypothetical protein